MIRVRSGKLKKPTVQITVGPGGVMGIDLVTRRPGSMIEQDRLFGLYLHLLDGIDLLERGARDFHRKESSRLITRFSGRTNQASAHPEKGE